MKEYLETGKVVGTHGIRGDLKIECWCDSPDFLSSFKNLYLGEEKTKLDVKCRPHKNIALIKIKGVDTIEDATRFIGKVLYIKRDDVKLEEGKYFIDDIIGLDVIDIDTNKVYGKITDVIKTGSNDVYVMNDTNKKVVYIPVIPDIVKDRDIENGKVFITPMKGLFDDEN